MPVYYDKVICLRCGADKAETEKNRIFIEERYVCLCDNCIEQLAEKLREVRTAASKQERT